MSTYLVRLTPQEPYFFGNEKNLEFKGQKNRGQMTNRYYIKSERTPLQTTLLGANNELRDRLVATPFNRNGDRHPRYYQEIAIRNVLTAIANGQQR